MKHSQREIMRFCFVVYFYIIYSVSVGVGHEWTIVTGAASRSKIEEKS